MDIERLTARNKDGIAYLVNVKPNEQEVDSPHKNTLKCILDCFERLAQYEEEAIARQSVKSEEVQEAIEWVKDEIADLSYGDDEVEASYPHREDEILNTILNALWSAIPETEMAVCPNCNGSGVYQEYDDEYDRYHVYACYKCEGTGEIARQSATSEDNWKELREDFMHNLRGCDTVTVSLNGVGSTDYSTEDIYNMIASLTDNQVVEKSATTEDVQEAIEWLKGMERSYNLDRATGFASSKHDEAAEHCRVLLTALQAYQPWVSVSERLPETGNHCQNHRKENE